MVVRPARPRPPATPGRGGSTLDVLSRHRRAFAVAPTVLILVLAAALFVGLLTLDWFVVGAIVAGPAVTTALLAVDRLQHR